MKFNTSAVADFVGRVEFRHVAPGLLATGNEGVLRLLADRLGLLRSDRAAPLVIIRGGEA